MNKKTLLVSGAILSIAIASPIFAHATTTGTGTSTATAAQIVCVGKAVATRESAFDSGESAYQSTENAAYSARSKSLAVAYATGTTAGVSSGIKTAWATFDAAIKTDSATWATKRLTAWASFKTAAAACKAPSGIIDSTT